MGDADAACFGITYIDKNFPAAQSLHKAVAARPNNDMPQSFDVILNNKKWTILIDRNKPNPIYYSLTDIVSNNIINMALYFSYTENNEYLWKFAQQMPSGYMHEQIDKMFKLDLHRELMHVQLMMEKNSTLGISELGKAYKKFQTDFLTLRQSFEIIIKNLVDQVNSEFPNNKININKLLDKAGEHDLFERFLQEKFINGRIGDIYEIRANNKIIVNDYSNILFSRIKDLSGLDTLSEKLKSKFQDQIKLVEDQLLFIYEKIQSPAEKNEISRIISNLNISPTAQSEDLAKRNDLLAKIFNEITNKYNQYYIVNSIDGVMNIKITDDLSLNLEQKQNLYLALINAITAYAHEKNIFGVYIVPDKDLNGKMYLKTNLVNKDISAIIENLSKLKTTPSEDMSKRNNLLLEILKGKNPYFTVKPSNGTLRIKISDGLNLSPEKKRDLYLALINVVTVYAQEKNISEVYIKSIGDGSEMTIDNMALYIDLTYQEANIIITNLSKLPTTPSEDMSKRNNLLLEILNGKNSYLTITQPVDKNGIMELKVADDLGLTQRQKQNLYSAFIKALTAYTQAKNISGIHVLPFSSNNTSVGNISLKIELKRSLLDLIKNSQKTSEISDTSASTNALTDVQRIISTLRPTYAQNNELRDKLVSEILRGESPYFELKPVSINQEEGIEISIKESANLSKEKKQELITTLNNALSEYQNERSFLGDIYQYPNKDFSRIVTGDFMKLANGTRNDIDNNKTSRLG